MNLPGIRVNLPAASAPPQNQQQKDFVAVRIQAGNAVYFDNQFVPDDQVLPRLYQLHAANKDLKVSISAELLAAHGDVITVLDKVKQAQITKIGYQIRAAPATTQ